MKKLIYSAAFLVLAGFATPAFAQLQDEKNVTITMDLQPILKLDMTTSDQVDFVFDNLAAYNGGITKYGATILKVSASIDWDLYAVGTSSNSAGLFWDNSVKYGAATDPNAIANIPLQALELHQNQPNIFNTSGTVPDDYSATFPLVTNPFVQTGSNNIYASATPYVLPANTEKFIMGGNDPLDFGTGGSYLTQGTATSSIFYYAIDYRIVPGLPAIFPTSSDNAATPMDLVSLNAAGAYAQPGVYTMNVKYVLLENQ